MVRKTATTEVAPLLGVGRLEAKVLGALESLSSPVTARQVCNAIGKPAWVARESVLNCMNRMAGKGMLAASWEGNSRLFTPLVTADAVAVRLITGLVSQLGVDLNRVVALALGLDVEIGAREIARLQERARAWKR
jgi:predicted transcriptional regulator